jgi:hypothetical protein
MCRSFHFTADGHQPPATDPSPWQSLAQHCIRCARHNRCKHSAGSTPCMQAFPPAQQPRCTNTGQQSPRCSGAPLLGLPATKHACQCQSHQQLSMAGRHGPRTAEREAPLAAPRQLLPAAAGQGSSPCLAQCPCSAHAEEVAPAVLKSSGQARPPPPKSCRFMLRIPAPSSRVPQQPLARTSISTSATSHPAAAAPPTQAALARRLLHRAKGRANPLSPP